MDVTRENFAEIYPQFKALLDTCKYMAMDEEMTGIWAIGDANQQRRDDTPHIRYGKMIEVASKYSIIQLGVCLFHDAEDGSALVATPFNFYLFPNTGGDLVMSPSSIDFLRKNNMNFDTWISKGVTFVDAAGEVRVHNYLYPTETAEPKPLIVLTRPSDITFTEECMGKVVAMLADTGSEGVEPASAVVLQPSNAFLRRVLYEQLETRFPGQVNVTKNEQGHMVVTKVDPATQEAVLAAQKAEKESKFFAALGFRTVFNDLVAAKKPMVGHNMLFNLLFMLRWLDAPLAADLETFRARFHAMFPVVYDTKYLATLAPNGALTEGTSLEVCYKYYVTDRAGVEIRMSALVKGYDELAPQFHNAGYDAYVTGCVFARQLQRLQDQGGALQMPPGCILPVGDDVPCAATAEACANMLYMMRSCYHLCLDPQRPAGLVHVTGALVRVSGIDGAKTNNATVLELLTAAGLKVGQFEIMLVDKVSFLLHLPGHRVGELREEDGARSLQFVALTVPASESAIDESAAGMEEVPDVWMKLLEGWVVQGFAEYQEEWARCLAAAAVREDEEPAQKRVRVEA